MTIFVEGDKVRTRKDVSEYIASSGWFYKNSNIVMTVDKAGPVESDNKQHLFLKENEFVWSNDWLEKVEDYMIEDIFIREDEFEL